MTFPPFSNQPKETPMATFNPSTTAKIKSSVVTGVILIMSGAACVLLGGVLGYGRAQKDTASGCNKIEAFTTPYGDYQCFPYEKAKQEPEEGAK